MRRLQIILVVLAILVAWELVRRADLVSPILLASPTEIARAFAKSGGKMLATLLVTIPTVLGSIALAWVFGILIGLICGLSPLLSMSFGPILSSLFSIPLIIWYPMIVVWAGIGPPSKVVFALVCGVLPIALNVLSATELVDRRYLLAARSFGATGPTLIWRVLMPLALPGILAGLRIGTGLTVVGVIVGEMLVSLGGIGNWISYHRTTFDTPEVYAGIVLVLAFILGINFVMGRFERAWQST